jgi:hypothetical protein
MCLEDWGRPAYISVQRSDETPPSSLCPRRGLPPPEPASTWRHPPPAATRHKRRLLDLLPRQTPYSFRATAPVTNSLDKLYWGSAGIVHQCRSWTGTGGRRLRSIRWKGYPLTALAMGDRVRSDRLPEMFPQATPPESRPAPVRRCPSRWACW